MTVLRGVLDTLTGSCLFVAYINFRDRDNASAGGDALRAAGFTALFGEGPSRRRIYGYAIRVIERIDFSAMSDEVLELIAPFGGWSPKSQELLPPLDPEDF